MADPRAAAPTDVDDRDWPAQAADAIEKAVSQVRDRTTGPALTAARAVVYGTFAAILGTVVLALLLVGLVRVLDAYLPQEVWLPYLILGSIFTIAGVVLWSRRRAAGR